MFLFALLIFCRGANALDCSQFTDFDSCKSTYCDWRQFECKCASPVNLDILFTISTSAYIGETNFNALLKPWLNTITQIGINIGTSQVGWNIFSASSTLTDIESQSYDQMETDIQSIEYDAGVADLATALMKTESAFSNSAPNRQKLNIIIMASNPYKQGTTPSERASEVCQYSAQLKQSGIQNIFIGIGKQWSVARIDCLVQDTSTDIIKIDHWNQRSLNDSLPTIYDILCPIDFNLKITEIKPVYTNGGNARFVEFFNMGRDIQTTDSITLSGSVSGVITNVNIDQGQYAVLYNTDDGQISCDTCNSSAVEIECGNGNAYDCAFSHNMNVTDFSIDIMYDSVSYSNSNYWPIIADGYTYALEYLGYNNQYGANYIRSCDMYGTPGGNNRECATAELACTIDTDCGGSIYTQCSDSKCVCADIGYYLKQNKCYPIPQPSNCIAYLINNDTQKYTRFIWEAAEIDSSHISYGNVYYQNGFSQNQMVTVVDLSRIRNEDDLYNQVTDIAGYVFTRMTDGNNNEYNSGSWLTNCTIITQSPTAAPTLAPTFSPTLAPTESPTSAPTWQVPKIFMSGEFCDRDRCDCAGQGFECCVSDNNGTMESNCTAQQLKYIVGNDVFHSFKIYPEQFPYETQIQWRVRFNGTVTGISNYHLNNSMDNPLQISVFPMNGTSVITGDTSVNIKLYLNESEINCADNGTSCKDVLAGLNAVFILEITDCSFMNGDSLVNVTEDECEVIYPYELVMYITRNDIGTGGGAGHEDKVPTWLWFVLGAGALFLALLSYLVYRYWWKGKKQDTDYQILKDDVEIQKVQNDQDFETNLVNNKDVAFNPLATGMPGVDKNHDPLTAEVAKREMLQQNEMIQEDGVKQVFKEDMGQVHGKLSEHRQ